jgi:protocatechuate 3,4-dioxygenase beta subunit
VRLETPGGTPLQATRSDNDGRYTFDGLSPAHYRLRWRALGRTEPQPLDLEVPSPTGNYDLSFP